MQNSAHKALTIEEATSITKTLDMRSPAALDVVRVYLSSRDANEDFAGRMKELLAIHQEIVENQVLVRIRFQDSVAELSL